RTKKLYAFEPNNMSDYENLDDHIWSDHKIDERASNYFAVLLMASFKRTQRHKKVELRKAAQNTRSITTYLAPALTTSTFKSSTESIEMESIEVESIGVESAEMELIEVESAEMELIEVESTADLFAEIDLDERTKMRLAIEELERTLKKDDNQMDKGVRVRLQASLQYLRLRYQGQTRISASTMIASSLGWGDYKAQYIAAWAQNWIKWRKLPKENHGKFTKVSSLLDDERISMKVLKERKLYVRKWHRDGLKNWASIELEPVLVEYDDKNLSKFVKKDISSEQKRHCVITHDETTLNANNNKKTG
ncbi:18814_t:CDS:2, partial [Racocetra persica]